MKQAVVINESIIQLKLLKMNSIYQLIKSAECTTVLHLLSGISVCTPAATSQTPGEEELSSFWTTIRYGQELMMTLSRHKKCYI